MNLAEWWADYGDLDPIRQGDVLRRPADLEGAYWWGLVITADCDIVQGKAGDRFTWLSVVPAHAYLRERWAPEQLRRIRDKQARPTAEAVAGHLRRADAHLDPLTPESLLRWLETHDAEAIWQAVAPGKVPDNKLVQTLTALRMAIGHEGPPDPLDRLRATWSALGRGAVQQDANIREAFEGERGFPDFFLLPDLPQADSFGHVVLLRDIASIPAREVFATEHEARAADQPDAFVRIARLDDGVRFAITQKLAFLFSRIGLPSAFEHACSAATELVVEAIRPGVRS